MARLQDYYRKDVVPDLMKKFGKDYYLSNLSYDAVLCPKMLSRRQCRLTFE